MSGPSIPPDNSLALEQSRQAAATTAQQAQDAKDAARKTELAELRSNAGTAGRASARDYFTQQGLNPDQYSGTIDSKINDLLATVAPDDPNPGAYFSNAGQNIYDSAQANQRTKYGHELDTLFPSNFDSQRLSTSLDDPYLTSIEGEQRSDADKIIQNMLDRGVITGAGSQAARNELDRQTFSVRDQLNTLGNETIAGGQQALRDVANKGRTAASTTNLGQAFDPSTYGKDADTIFNDFVANLGGKIKAKIPGSLFQTNNLASIAGAGQGAQNTKFNPNALAGIINPNKDNQDDPNKPITAPEMVF